MKLILNLLVVVVVSAAPPAFEEFTALSEVDHSIFAKEPADADLDKEEVTSPVNGSPDDDIDIFQASNENDTALAELPLEFKPYNLLHGGSMSYLREKVKYLASLPQQYIAQLFEFELPTAAHKNSDHVLAGKMQAAVEYFNNLKNKNNKPSINLEECEESRRVALAELQSLALNASLMEVRLELLEIAQERAERQARSAFIDVLDCHKHMAVLEYIKNDTHRSMETINFTMEKAKVDALECRMSKIRLESQIDAMVTQKEDEHANYRSAKKSLEEMHIKMLEAEAEVKVLKEELQRKLEEKTVTEDKLEQLRHSLMELRTNVSYTNNEDANLQLDNCKSHNNMLVKQMDILTQEIERPKTTHENNKCEEASLQLDNLKSQNEEHVKQIDFMTQEIERLKTMHEDANLQLQDKLKSQNEEHVKQMDILTQEIERLKTTHEDNNYEDANLQLQDKLKSQNEEHVKQMDILSQEIERLKTHEDNNCEDANLQMQDKLKSQNEEHVKQMDILSQEIERLKTHEDNNCEDANLQMQDKLKAQNEEHVKQMDILSQEIERLKTHEDNNCEDANLQMQDKLKAQNEEHVKQMDILSQEIERLKTHEDNNCEDANLQMQDKLKAQNEEHVKQMDILSQEIERFKTTHESIEQLELNRAAKPKAVKQVLYSGDLCTTSRIDAAFNENSSTVILFKGPYYWVMTEDEGITHDAPRLINETWPDAPLAVHAAFYNEEEESVYFFYGSQYWQYKDFKLLPDFPKEISKGFPGIPNNIDAAFIWKITGKLYLFKDKSYWQAEGDDSYTVQRTHVKSGGTRLHVAVPHNLDAIFDFQNSTIFLKNDLYYRYSDNSNMVAESLPPYPRLSCTWLFGCPASSECVKRRRV